MCETKLKICFVLCYFALDLTNPLKQYYDEGSKYSNITWVYYMGILLYNE